MYPKDIIRGGNRMKRGMVKADKTADRKTGNADGRDVIYGLAVFCGYRNRRL